MFPRFRVIYLCICWLTIYKHSEKLKVSTDEVGSASINTWMIYNRLIIKIALISQSNIVVLAVAKNIWLYSLGYTCDFVSKCLLSSGIVNSRAFREMDLCCPTP